MGFLGKSKDKKLKLFLGAYQEYLDLYFNQPTLSENYRNFMIGDWVIEVSGIHRDLKWTNIGKLIKNGDKNNDGFVIKTIENKKVTWDNAMFYRLPDTIQKLMLGLK